MSPLTLLLTALGLAADAFAVSVAKGVSMRRLDVRPALAMALTFGGFQALMPVLGWALGSRVAATIRPWDHWIAFALLAAVGAKMLWEARGVDDAEADASEPGVAADAGAAPRPAFRIGTRELLVLGVATSIDALAVGVSFAFVDVSIWLAAATIGGVTFAASMIGTRLGHHAGSWLSRGAEALGGLVLIGIGVKIVLEHTGS